MSVVDSPLVMDELISNGLLIKDADDLRFRHEMARVAIEAAVPPYRKAAIHTKIMDALLSSGSDDDARLAFHAEGAENAELVLTYAPRAGHRAAELGARREAAAQYERALRFVPDADLRTRAELLDNLAQQLDFVDRWENFEDICHAAVALWHELGDSARESDSLLNLAWGRWRLCRGAEFRRASNAALKLAKSLGPSPQLANAYNTLAYRHLSEGRYDDSLAVGRRVREMSEQLGLDGDLISDSLNLEAFVVRAIGKDWTVPMRAALEIALSGGHEYRAGGVFVNMYGCIAASSATTRVSRSTTRPLPTATYTTSAAPPTACWPIMLVSLRNWAAGTSASLSLTPCWKSGRSLRQTGYSHCAIRRK
jgi:tetratricopeptide (TPR) repeat protein